MLHKTAGIVFKYFKYRDTSIIAKVYTQAFGMQSYIVNGVRSSKSKGKIAFFQPMTLLDLVVYKKNDTSLHRISEMKCSHPLKTIPYNIKKSSISVFLTELLYKVIKEDEGDDALFMFLYNSIIIFDQLPENYNSFHLSFLFQLSHYLGIGITDGLQIVSTLKQNEIPLINELMQSEYHTLPKISNQMRRFILEDLIKFYQTHLDSLHDLKSLAIIRSVLQ